MPSTHLWARSLPRAELDQRAHATRLHLVRMEQLLVPRAAWLNFRPGWLVCLLGLVSDAPTASAGWFDGSVSAAVLVFLPF